MRQSLKIYYTSDTHGYIFPTNYVSKETVDMGLLACGKAFEKDGNTLILDGGDTIQGSAFSKYMWEHEKEGCTIAEVFNAARYDYVTLGNHDFNYDYEGVKRYVGGLEAKCLLANVKDTKGEINFLPYTIHTLDNGLRVGLVGIVTDYVRLWEKPEHLTDFKVEDTFEAAKRSYEMIKDQCDISICIYHGGYECDLETGKILAPGNENVGYRICEELGYDVLLTAHQHMPVEGRWIHGTYTMQLMPNAQRYGFLEIQMTEEGLMINSKTKQPKGQELLKIKSEWADKQQKVEAWLDEKAGAFTEAIPAHDKLTLALEGSRLADFCNQLQLEHTEAELSCISLGNNPVGFNEEVTTRDILAAYQFPNTIKVLAVTPEVIRQALERCAEYYDLEGGEAVISKRFLEPKVEHYNYDFFAGIEYTFDLTKDLGQRVVLMTRDGKELENRTYTLAMSDYRATGTGGYGFYQDCSVVKEYAVDIQELAIQFIRENKLVQIMKNKGFKINI